MSTAEREDDSQSPRITLHTHQTLVIPKLATVGLIRLCVHEGILRISCLPNNDRPEITLALTSSLEQGVFWYPNSAVLQLEAISDSSFSVQTASGINDTEYDFLNEWMFQLHSVRHAIKAEDRLLRLFKLLIRRFGKRTPEGYLLEFLLSHSRLGEIIGATRSTVSRGISTLKQSNTISIDELRGQLTMPINNSES